jgi:hypothetical protein
MLFKEIITIYFEDSTEHARFTRKMQSHWILDRVVRVVAVGF